MKKISRRSALGLMLSSAAVVAGWAFVPSNAFSSTPLELKENPLRRNTLVAVGLNGHLSPDVFLGKLDSSQNMLTRKSHSLVTEIGIRDGQVKQTAIPLSRGHGALRLNNGNLLITPQHNSHCMILDDEHKVVETVKSKEGYLYGGHAWFVQEKGIIVVTQRHAEPENITDTGILSIHDAKTFKLLDQFNSHGVHPHEVRVLPGSEEIVITHYGEVRTTNNKNLSFDIVEPKLSVYDINSFEMVREYVQPIDGIYTHMDVGVFGDVYAVANQYISFRNMTPSQLDARAKELGYPVKSLLNLTSESENLLRLPVPFGIIKVDPKTGKRDVFLSSKEDHLRSQSVAAHNASKRVFATYAYSNKLIVIDEVEKKVTAIDGYNYGIRQIRGVTSIPDSDYIAISDTDRGVVILNAYTLKPVRTFPTRLMTAPHIFAT